MVLLRARSHAALVAVACVATALFTSVAHAAPFTPKNLNTDFSTNFTATNNNNNNNNGGLGFDFSSSSSFGGSSSSSSGSSGGFGSSNSQGSQPNFFEQLARTSQLVGSMLNSFFSSLGRQNTRAGSSGGSSGSPLVAIDTRSGAPTIDIPGIFGLNTGHTRDGGGDSLVSVNTQLGARVRAPFVNIDTNKGSTRVQAPFTDVSVNSGGTRVQAPFTNVNTNKAGTSVQAPFTDVNTNGGGTRVQAPFVTVDTRKETNEIMHLPSAQRNLITHTGFVFPARSEGTSISQLTPLSLNSHFSLTSNRLFPPAPKPTRHHPFLRTSAPSRSVSRNPAPPRNIQKSTNLASSASFTTTTTTTSTSRPESVNQMKFTTGLAGYKRIRFNPNLMPNFFLEMNPSPNDIPHTLVRKGYDTPHKVRMYVIDKATEMMEKAKIVN